MLNTKQTSIVTEIEAIRRDLTGDLDQAERADLTEELELAQAEARTLGVPESLI